MAFLRLDPTGLLGDFPPYSEPGPNTLNGLPRVAAGSFGIVGLAMFALNAMQQAAPVALGLSADDIPVIAFRAWKTDGQSEALPVWADFLTAEQVRLLANVFRTFRVGQIRPQQNWRRRS